MMIKAFSLLPLCKWDSNQEAKKLYIF